MPRATPPSRRSGAAYSTRTPSGASARAVTRSWRPIPSGHDSARALTTVTLPSPSSPAARSRNAHFRRTLSTSATCVSGSEIARARPGNPPPEPRSATVLASRTVSISSATSESATWTSTPRAGSRTDVMDAGSVATRSRSAARCDVACPGRPCRAASSSRRAWTAGDATMRTVRRETPRRPAIGAITHTTCGSNAAARGLLRGAEKGARAGASDTTRAPTRAHTTDAPTHGPWG